MSAETIVNRTSGVGYFPSDDRWAHIAASACRCFDRGEQARVPILAGFNEGRNPFTAFLLPPRPPADADAIRVKFAPVMAILPTHSWLGIRPTSLGEHVGDGPATACPYGWTAERLVVEAKPPSGAVLSLLLRSRLPWRLTRAGRAPSRTAFGDSLRVRNRQPARRRAGRRFLRRRRRNSNSPTRDGELLGDGLRA